MSDRMDQFLALAGHNLRENLDWRVGQAFWNAACVLDSSIPAHVVGLGVDPFYVDSRLPSFLKFLQRKWDQP